MDSNAGASGGGLECDTTTTTTTTIADPSTYFDQPFEGIYGTDHGDHAHVAGNTSFSAAGDMVLEVHHHQHHHSGAPIGVFHYSEVASAGATPMIQPVPTHTVPPPPGFDWQGTPQLYDSSLFSPSYSAYEPDYFGSWAPGAHHHHATLMGLVTTPQRTDQEQHLRQLHQQRQDHHQASGQVMTPPDDGYPGAQDASQQQQRSTFQAHFDHGYGQMQGSGAPTSRALNAATTSTITTGNRGIATTEASDKIVFSPATVTEVGDDTQPGLSPPTPSNYFDTPSTFILSPPSYPQTATPNRRRRASTTASSPALSTTIATITTAALTVKAKASASPRSPSEASDRPRPRHTSASKARVGGGKRQASTDDDGGGALGDDDGAPGVSAGAGKLSSRPRSNRDAAKKCREKTRLNQQQLEDRSRDAVARNDQLKRELSSVQGEAQMLRSQVLMHACCENENITRYIEAKASQISENASSPVPAPSPAKRPAPAPSRLQPLTSMPINGRLNFRLQPPPQPMTRRPPL